MVKGLLFLPFLFLTSISYGASVYDIGNAISNARAACGGINLYLSEMKKMAGINTAVTGVGTVVGIGATATGIAKSAKDKEHDEIIAELEEMGVKKIETEEELISLLAKLLEESDDQDDVSLAKELYRKKNSLEEKSKKLGNWRTGLLAVNTATNVAGTVIANKNRVDSNLYEKIDACRESIKELSAVRMQIRVSGESDETQDAVAKKIIDACGDWELVDLSSVDNRARGATISSGVGVGTGLAGTIVSAIANSKNVRDSDNGKKEKNLNAAANVLAGGATVVSGVATVFNATQINAIKKAVETADKCEEALQ